MTIADDLAAAATQYSTTSTQLSTEAASLNSLIGSLAGTVEGLLTEWQGVSSQAFVQAWQRAARDGYTIVNGLTNASEFSKDMATAIHTHLPALQQAISDQNAAHAELLTATNDTLVTHFQDQMTTATTAYNAALQQISTAASTQGGKLTEGVAPALGGACSLATDPLLGNQFDGVTVAIRFVKNKNGWGIFIGSKQIGESMTNPTAPGGGGTPPGGPPAPPGGPACPPGGDPSFQAKMLATLYLSMWGGVANTVNVWKNNSWNINSQVLNQFQSAATSGLLSNQIYTLAEKTTDALMKKLPASCDNSLMRKTLMNTFLPLYGGVIVGGIIEPYVVSPTEKVLIKGGTDLTHYIQHMIDNLGSAFEQQQYAAAGGGPVNPNTIA